MQFAQDVAGRSFQSPIGEVCVEACWTVCTWPSAHISSFNPLSGKCALKHHAYRLWLYTDDASFNPLSGKCALKPASVVRSTAATPGFNPLSGKCALKLTDRMKKARKATVSIPYRGSVR